MRIVIACFKLMFALLALLIGSSMILWVLYNEFINRLPEYERPPFAGIFGIAPAMIIIGLYWARSVLDEFRKK
jgi:hypothetical protein